MALPARAGTAPATLPLVQGWADAGQISVDDDWSRVAGIVGYRGDGLVAEPGSDPRGVTADGSGTPVDVAANLTDPRAVGLAAGVAEFELPDPVVAIQGSATASAPHLVMSLDTRGRAGVTVRLLVRDIDATAHDAVEPVALQYRVGAAGPFAAVPGGYVADATSGPGEATQVTRVSVNLPAAADGQPLVQVRVITTNAAGQDEWVGIDDIEASAASVGGGGTGGCPGPAPAPAPSPDPGSGPKAPKDAAPELTGLELGPGHLHAREARPGAGTPRARGSVAAVPAVARGAGPVRGGAGRRRARGLRAEAGARPLRAEDRRARARLRPAAASASAAVAGSTGCASADGCVAGRSPRAPTSSRRWRWTAPGASPRQRRSASGSTARTSRRPVRRLNIRQPERDNVLSLRSAPPRASLDRASELAHVGAAW